MAPHSSTLAWKIPWTEEPGGLQSMGLLRVGHYWATSLFHFHALEKEMATHSSILAWRIPGTGEPDGLLSMGTHRVGHDWSDLAAGSSVGKESACSAGDPGSIPGSGRSPGEGNGKPLQYPCLENLMDRGAWWAAVHGPQSGAWLRLCSVQISRSVVSDSLWSHEPQPARLPCPSPTPGVYPNSCAMSRWCHQWLVGLKD